MIVVVNAQGTVTNVEQSPVYQGSNLSGSIYFIAPFSRVNAVTVSFKLPNGINTQSYRMTGVSELDGITDKLGNAYSVWEWQDANAEVTNYAGVCVAQFGVYLPNGQLLTTSRTSFEVHEGVLDDPPPNPSPDVYALILRYLALFDARTENVPYLVRSIQKVAGNAFTYTNESGSTSEPIVLSGGADAPIPVNTGSKVQIHKYKPDTEDYAWTPFEVDGDIAYYTYIIDAEMHQQMRDNAQPSDLWVSVSTVDGTDLLGYFPRYTVDTSGNITIYVNQPIDMYVRVWNGKSIVDTTARELIADETKRAEDAEQKLRDDMANIVNGNVDETARTQIGAEIKRATAAEQTLEQAITAETSRAEGVESQLRNDLDAEIERSQTQDTSLDERITTAEGDIAALQTDVTDLKSNPVISIINFTTLGWTDTSQALAYLGTKSIKLTIPTGKQIIQVLEKHPTKMLITPRGTWQDNYIFANSAFNGVAIVV